MGQSEVLNPVPSLVLSRLHLKTLARVWHGSFYTLEKCLRVGAWRETGATSIIFLSLLDAWTWIPQASSSDVQLFRKVTHCLLSMMRKSIAAQAWN